MTLPRWNARKSRGIFNARRSDPDAASCAGDRSLLRFLTCGSVDDGKSTLIGRLLYNADVVMDDQLEALKAEFAALRHDRRRHRFLAVARRARGRAPAAHHDRCRLPLFLDPAPLVHRRRQPGPRAIHAQHGDRRLERRSRGAAGRCPQGRAAADPPAFADLLAVRHPPCRARGQQARSRRIRPRLVRQDRDRLRAIRRRSRFRLAGHDPAVGAPRRQPDRALAAHALVSGAEPARTSRNDRRDRGRRRPEVPFPGAMGQPPEPGIPRVFGHRCVRRGGAGRPNPGHGFVARLAGQGDRHLRRSAGARLCRRRGDPDPGGRDRHRARRHAGASAMRRANSPTSSPRISSG